MNEVYFDELEKIIRKNNRLPRTNNNEEKKLLKTII